MIKEMKTTGEKQKLPQFKSQIVTRVHNVLAMAGVGEQPLTSTRWITVPCITNSKDLEEGDEFIVQHVPRVQKNSSKRKSAWERCAKGPRQKETKAMERKETRERSERMTVQDDRAG